MSIKLFLTVFATVFLAELGDKTQLATMLFASREAVSPWLVFLGASAALVVCSALGVAAGSLVAQYVSPKYLSYAAGVGFIAVGIWTVWAAP
ncbi:MAG TPA: TMEM165/GDT1 family protein [Gammaproteobacteria bacterium]